MKYQTNTIKNKVNMPQVNPIKALRNAINNSLCMKKKTGEQVHCKHTQTERRARQSLKTTLHFPL